MGSKAYKMLSPYMEYSCYYFRKVMIFVALRSSFTYGLLGLSSGSLGSRDGQC